VFGTYTLSTDIKEDDVEITVEGKGKRKRYFRRVGKDEIEKVIYAKGGNLVICPVEPVNLPQEGVAEHLLIELNKNLIIESGVTDTIYVKFPIEIGVFLVDTRDVERIDLFTKTKSKYILYGPPETGIICKWWKSDIFDDKPSVQKLSEGILKVEIANKYYEWVELTKMVFRAYDMKVFYDDFAYIKARLTILNKSIGETTFSTRRPKEMTESLDIYLSKGVQKLEKKFTMEWRFK
jgi:hypothetical protein